MTPLIVLFSAILAGFVLRHKVIGSVPAGVTQAIVCLLLLFLGIAVGSDPGVAENFGGYGLRALVIGVLTTLGSVLAAWLLDLFTSSRRRK